MVYQDEDVDIEEEIDIDDPIIPFEDELFGASLLQKHYVIETEDVKGMSSIYKKLR